MCGIVGYVGNKTAQNVLLSGLKRLEYRGYDSAGIATLDDEKVPHIARSVGKISELEQVLSAKPHEGHLGIGHTRWATHGGVTVANAHPHHVGNIYLVHNGIIENYKELKEKLSSYTFASDTDTEVLAALIDSNYKEGTTLKDAVAKSLKEVRGTYGIAVFSPEEPDTIVVARLGSPLIIGLGKDETIIASDASALLGYTREAIYLNDGEIAVCNKNGAEVFNLNLKHLNPNPEKIEGDVEQIQKGGYDHFLLKEIMEQATTLPNTLSGRVDAKNGTMHLGGPNLTEKEMRDVRHIVIVGCGTAYYAGLLASYYMEQLIPDITTEVVIASEYRYRSFHLPKESIALIVSQSGETADTLACLREIKKRGVKTLGIVNVIGSTIAREVDGGTLAITVVIPNLSISSQENCLSFQKKSKTLSILIAPKWNNSQRNTQSTTMRFTLVAILHIQSLSKARSNSRKSLISMPKVMLPVSLSMAQSPSSMKLSSKCSTSWITGSMTSLSAVSMRFVLVAAKLLFSLIAKRTLRQTT